jgi:two-component system chemotaxis sensor kinase CheA
MQTPNKVNLKLDKYRAIVISIAFFLVFDLGVLILNYFISSQIKGDAVAVNLAGRQRMLSQRMVKALHEIQDSALSGKETASSLKELQLTFDLFDNTLNSFHLGGHATGGDGQPVWINRVTSPVGLKAIDQALVIWLPFRQKLLTILDANDVSLPKLLPETIAYAKDNNLSLLKLMNTLTSDLEEVAASKANRLRLIQTIGIFLALGNFFLILFHFLRQMRQRDRAIELAKQETDEILGTVNEGLFLIDANFNIGSQYSSQLEPLLGETELADKNFLDILKQRVADNVVAMSKDYLELLFEGRVKEKLVTSLNPLHEVQYKASLINPHVRNKFLDFSFNRVVEREGVKHILVTANDVTQKVLLLKELEKSELNNMIQIELLLDMLKVSPSLLKEFIDKTESELHGINQILKNQKSHAHRETLQEIFAVVHTIKGNASAINMSLFEQRMHEFEEAISNVLDRNLNITGQDFLSLAIKLESSMQLVDIVRSFLERIIEINREFAADNQNSLQLVSDLEKLAQRIGEDKGKKIVLDYRGFNPNLIPFDKQSPVRDILLQLLRNSVVHGIELPDERKLANKAETGRITLTTQSSGKSINVVLRDDGRGIDIETIRDRAINSGVWSKDEVSNWDKTKLISLIFEDRFSTAENADRDAGRGIGMSAVKRTLKTIGGNLGIKFVPGQYCEFRISVPAATVAP